MSDNVHSIKEYKLKKGIELTFQEIIGMQIKREWTEEDKEWDNMEPIGSEVIEDEWSTYTLDDWGIEDNNSDDNR